MFQICSHHAALGGPAKRQQQQQKDTTLRRIFRNAELDFSPSGIICRELSTLPHAVELL